MNVPGGCQWKGKFLSRISKASRFGVSFRLWLPAGSGQICHHEGFWPAAGDSPLQGLQRKLSSRLLLQVGNEDVGDPDVHKA